jgi:hypothetical protein
MKRQKNDRHLDFIRGLPCAVCLDDTATEAAHLRYTEPKVGRINPGMQQKPHDWFVVPLCGDCHREQHGGSEKAFWNGTPIDPNMLALALYAISGDHEAGERIVRAWH